MHKSRSNLLAHWAGAVYSMVHAKGISNPPSDPPHPPSRRNELSAPPVPNRFPRYPNKITQADQHS